MQQHKITGLYDQRRLIIQFFFYISSFFDCRKEQINKEN